MEVRPRSVAGLPPWPRRSSAQDDQPRFAKSACQKRPTLAEGGAPETRGRPPPVPTQAERPGRPAALREIRLPEAPDAGRVGGPVHEHEQRGGGSAPAARGGGGGGARRGR